MLLMPQWLMQLPIYSNSGHLIDTDYGWRFFPGGSGTRKAIKAMRAAGWKVQRMTCGTYKVTAGT